MGNKKSGNSTSRYRISLRLDKKHETLLRRLESEVGHSRNELLREALCHFYWTVLVKGQAAWIYLPPDVMEVRGQVDELTHRRRAAR